MNQVSALVLGLILNLSFNTSAQQNLILNGGFEDLALLIFSEDPLTIDGQIITHQKSRDTSALWFLNGDKKINSPVSSKYWNFSDTSYIYSKSTFFSNTGNSYEGNSYGRITPFRIGVDINTKEIQYNISNLVAQICTPLQKDHLYHFSLWIKPFRGNYRWDHIDIHFSSEQMPYEDSVLASKKKKIIAKHQSQHKLIPHCRIRVDTIQPETYTPVSCTYQARGGELYVYIGNLDYDYPYDYKKKDLKPYGSLSTRASYVPNCSYLIDEVILVSLSDKEEFCPKIVSSANPIPTTDLSATSTNTITKQLSSRSNVTDSIGHVASEKTKKEFLSIILKFENNRSQISRNDSIQLISQFQTLDFQAIKKIHITGHTDHIGSEKSNMQLSIQRAKTIEKIISRLFIKQSLPLPNIITTGKSFKEQITNDQSELGRSQNRRVEIKVEY